MNEFNAPDLERAVGGRGQPSVSFAMPPEQASSASSYADLQFLFGVQDPKMVPKPNRNRRKSTHGPDHAKHRRTRSGCFTCRSRRVKCDENRPVCERCRKGNRDCVYPEPPTSSKGSSSGSSKSSKPSTHESPGTSSDEYEVEGERERLEVIPDVDEGLEDDVNHRKASKREPIRHSNSQTSTGQKSSPRHDSETPSLVQDKGSSPTPSTEGSVGYSSYQTLGGEQRRTQFIRPTAPEDLRSDWSHLPSDLQFYLQYFYENITYLHYSFKYDSCNFLQTIFLDAALRNDALLHAVVGFSAFQRSLHNPEGKIEDFLPYYNKAVSLLLLSLKRGERHDLGTVLAILQLATIEEFLGDWINLLGHQKAAFEIITEIYTPRTIMETQMTRIILAWYVRFDVFAGLLGGFETTLSREWFAYSYEYFRELAIKEPECLDWKIEAVIAQYRLIATDMSLLFATIGKGEITQKQFMIENEDISRRLEEWSTKLDPALQDPRYLVTDFGIKRPVDPDDIVDPYLPGQIYDGPLWSMNITRLDWTSIDLMHKYQTALTLGTQPSAELIMKAYASCQLFEAMEYYSGSPRGTIVTCQASLGIAFLFLPRDDTHAMWARRKLASIEANGYIYPYTFRSKMAALFREKSCMHWWLPNDEGYPQILRSIRRFVEERTSPPKDLTSENLHDMKAIFASLNLDDARPAYPQAEPGRGKSEDQEWPDPSINSESMHFSPNNDRYGFDDSSGF